MALSQAEVAILLKAQDTASPTIAKTSSELEKLGAAGQQTQSKMGGMSGALANIGFAAATAGAVGLGAAMVGAVTSAMNFEEQMSAVGAVMGASQAEMDILSSLALQLGKDTSFSATEAAKGLEELAKAGVSISDIIGGGAKAALDLAAAGSVSVADAAEIASNAMNVFGLKGADMAHVADSIAGAANASAISVNDYKYSLSAAGAVAATVGINFDDLTTAIALMGNAGIKGSDAGTSLKTMMLNLSPSTKKAKEEMRDLGIITADGANQFFTAEGKAKSFAEISEVLMQATKDLTQEQKLNSLQTIFGTDAIRAAAVMAGAGSDKFLELAGAIHKVGATEVADQRLDNLAGSLEKLKGSLETGAIILGRVFTPALKGLADAATNNVNAVIDAFEQIPDAVETVKQVIAGNWAPDSSIRPFTRAVGEAALEIKRMFGPAIQAAANFITGTMVPAFEKMKVPLAVFVAGFGSTVAAAGVAVTAFKGVTVALALLTSPLGLAAAAIGALAAAWVTNFGNIRGITQSVLTTLQPTFQRFAEVVQTALGGDIQGAIDKFLIAVNLTARELGPILAGWGRAFVEWVAVAGPPMLAAAAELGAQLLGWVTSQIGPLVAALITWGTAFVEWVGPAIPPMISAVTDLLTQLGGWITGTAVPVIVEALVTWATAFWEWVGPTIPPLISALGDLLTQFGGWITGTALPAIVEALVTWATAFWEWVGPAGAEAIHQLGVWLGQLTVWFASDGLPAIQASLAEWRLALSQWITDSGPDVTAALIQLMANIGTTLLDLPAIVLGIGMEAGRQLMAGMIEGAGGSVATLTASLQSLFEQAIRSAWEGAKAMIPSLGGINIPFSMGGGGGGLANTPTPMSYQATNSGGFANNAERLAFVEAMAAKYGHDPATVVAGAKMEGAGPAGPVGDNGQSFGALQAYTGGGMGNTFQQVTGLNPADPNNEKALVEWQISQLGQTGWTPYNGPTKVGGFSTFQGLNVGPRGPGRMDKLMPGSMAVPSDPSLFAADGFDLEGMADPNFMPQWVKDMEGVKQASDAWSESMATIGQSSKDAFTVVTGSSRQMGDQFVTVTGAASGEAVKTWTDASGNVVKQIAYMADGTKLQLGDMEGGVTSSTRNIGKEIMTTMRDTSGNVVTTITDLSGNVTRQWTTMGSSLAADAQFLTSDVTQSLAGLGRSIDPAVKAWTEGQISIGELTDSIIANANSQGIAQPAIAEYTAGLTDQKTALSAVLAEYAKTTPAAARLLEQLQNGSISTEEAAVAFAGLSNTTAIASGALDEMGIAATDAAEVMGEDVVDAAQDMASGTRTATAGMRQNVSGMIVRMANEAIKTAENMSDQSVEAIEEMADGSVDAVDEMGDDINKSFKDMDRETSREIQQMNQSVTDEMEDMQRQSGRAVDELTNGISTDVTQMVQRSVPRFEEFRSAVEETSEKVEDLADDIQQVDEPVALAFSADVPSTVRVDGIEADNLESDQSELGDAEMGDVEAEDIQGEDLKADDATLRDVKARDFEAPKGDFEDAEIEDSEISDSQVDQMDVSDFNAPGRASGGSVSRNKAYMVGEVGPELFVPGSSGNIVSYGDLRAGGGLMGESWVDYDRLGVAVAQALQGSRNNFSLTVHTTSRDEDILQDFALLESLARSR